MEFKECIESCRRFIESLTNIPVETTIILKWFQDLCRNFIDIINTVGRLNQENKDKFNKSTRNLIVLYLTQLITCLDLLRRTFIEEENIKLILLEARRCVKQQILYCFDSLKTTILNETIHMNPSGNFVKWMDDALNTINRIDIIDNNQQTMNLLKDTRDLFEEVLSHAMSIGQISLEQDCKIIRAGCQIVLKSLNSLTEELKKTNPDPSVVDLFVDVCCNKLCGLERKVNMAVLKLCLNTFKQFTKPLEIIDNYCLNQDNEGELSRNRDDFDNYVADFDLHVDRIMQIGLFAVSCSNDTLRGIKIRSCLASLEALESELVPSFNAVLFDKRQQNVYFALILKNHWINRAKSLQHLIYLIIDPFAFCQIIYEESKEIVDNLTKLTKNGELLKINDVNNLIDIAGVLKDFLNQARQEFNQIEMDKIDAKYGDFEKIMNEIRKATVLLKTNTINDSLRILKRCKILVTMIKRLWYSFIDDSTKENRSELLENFDRQSIRNHFLDHIIDRRKQILEQRSILYRSTIEINPIIRNSNDNHELSMKHLRQLSFINNRSRKIDNIDNQFTVLLDEITNLSRVQS